MNIYLENGLLDYNEIDEILKKRNYFPNKSDQYNGYYISIKNMLNKGYNFIVNNFSFSH